MKTRIIGPVDKITNNFTKYGRERNNLISELKQIGINHIRERKLPNNSRVMVCYKDKASSRVEYAFKVNPDLSLEQKEYRSSTIFSPVRTVIKNISRIFADNKGKEIKQEEKIVKYINDVPVYTSYSVNKGNHSKKIQVAANQYNLTDTKGQAGQSIRKITEFNEKKGNKINSYSCKEMTDGTRKYEKNIDGVEYSFTTNHS